MARVRVRGGEGARGLAEDARWVTSSGQSRAGAEGPGRDAPSHLRTSAPVHRKGVSRRLSVPGANPHPRLEPFGLRETVFNYYHGNDPSRWYAQVPVWSGVRYVDLYPGVDLEVTGAGEPFVWRLVQKARSPSQGRAGVGVHTCG